jgi:hypothetical protein
MMTSILDQSGDVTRQDFFRFAKLYDLPAYVKQASQGDIFDRDSKLPATVFADVRNREFKCATAADTWVSWLYFLEKAQPRLHHKIASWIEQRLTDFASYWSIDDDIRSLREKHAQLNAGGVSDDDYMIVWASENGDKIRKYPLTNPGETFKAAEWFLEYRDHFPYHDRKVMATKLREKAAEYCVVFNDNVETALDRQAGNGTYVPTKAAQFIRNRIAAAPTNTDPKMIEGLTKLADAIAINGHLATDPSTVSNLCHTIDTFDRVTKLAGHYTNLLPRPEDVLCEALYKQAKAALDEACQLTTGTVYNMQDFGNLKLSELRDAFGNDIADACADGMLVDPKKAAEVLGTLPRPDAVILDSVMEQCSIRPMGKAATAVERPAFDLLRQLASLGG